MFRRQSIIFLSLLFALWIADLARGSSEIGDGFVQSKRQWSDLETSTVLVERNLDNQPLLVHRDDVKIGSDLVPPVGLLMSQVLSSTVADYNGALSGDRPVIFAGQPYTIETRNTYSGEPIQVATQYVGQHLEDLELSVEYHVWGRTGLPDPETYPNVIGQLTGETVPDDIMMITAHLDSTSRSPLTEAPGADDNASGSTAVLIAADILSQYQWDCTLRFALWTGEEQGLRGSRAYAERAYEEDERIRGVLNLDMIAWNTAGSEPGIDLYSKRSIPGSVPLALTFSNVISDYGLYFEPELFLSGISNSDQESFWERGFPAMLAMEDRRDFNPNYHSTSDRLSNLDIDYFTEFVRAAVGTFALMADCDHFPQTSAFYLPVAMMGDPALGHDQSISLSR
jgi:hypothetical protein